jgi:FKBP-type peptidyl-prolyl cis-trans isomerase
MNKNFKYYTFAFLAIFFISACEKREYQTIEELDDVNISNYIRQNNINVQEYEETGIYYSILEEGTGQELDYEKKVPLVYTLKTLDGAFSSIDTFSAGNRYYDYLGYFPYGSAGANAPGSPLDKEDGMKVILKNVLKNTNGKIRIIVPSRLAFGRNGTKFIPPNSSIDYEIHAIDLATLPDYEDESIRQYMAANGLQLSDFEKTTTGIYYSVSEVGTGEFLNENTSFKAAYDLKFLDGKTFQKADSATFSLNGVIDAWKEVMPKVKENGKVRMLIPSSQAYGLTGSLDPQGAIAIPPFAALDYDVKVQSILK